MLKAVELFAPYQHGKSVQGKGEAKTLLAHLPAVVCNLAASLADWEKTVVNIQSTKAFRRVNLPFKLMISLILAERSKNQSQSRIRSTEPSAPWIELNSRRCMLQGNNDELLPWSR